MDKNLVNMFLAAYKHDSAVTINSFMRHQSKSDQKRGQFHSFSEDLGGFSWFTDFDNPGLALELIHFMDGLTYFPIDEQYIDMILNFGEFLGTQPETKEPMIVYRGCNDLDVDGVSGLVSASRKESVANQFDRGTILKIHMPKGMKYIDLDKAKSNKAKKSDDREEEVILPPCSYEILSDKTIASRNPNNISGKTRIVEISVKPKDFFREFLKAMENPPEDYYRDFGRDEEYIRAYAKLGNFGVVRTMLGAVGNKQVAGSGLYGSLDTLKKKIKKSDEPTTIKKSFEVLNLDEELPASEYTFMRQMIGDLKQISTKDFYNYINKSKYKNILNDYFSSVDHYSLYTHDDHDVNHVNNVTLFAYYLACKEGCFDKDGIRILLEAARYHDIGRINDWEDPMHGKRGAMKYNETFTTLPVNERMIISFLINAHSLQTKDVETYTKQFFKFAPPAIADLAIEMATIIRDADALDRTRFMYNQYDYINTNYLVHESAKEIIEVSQHLNTREKQLDFYYDYVQELNKNN